MNPTKPNISESVTSPALEAGSGGTNKDEKPPSSPKTSAWTEQKISNRISQTLEGSFMSLTQIMESSRDGSGFQEGHNELKQGVAPSISVLEENMIAQELEEKRDWEDTWYHFAPPLPQRQIQIMDGDRSHEITEAQTLQGVSSYTPEHATSTQIVPTTISILSQVKSVSSDWQSSTKDIATFQKEASLNLMTQTLSDSLNGKGSDDSMESNTALDQATVIVPGHPEDFTPYGATVPADQEANPHVTLADSIITTNPQLSHLENRGVHMVTQTIQSNQTGEEIINPTRILPDVPSEITSSRPDGTSLQWEDLSRTLAFAWELHVFGCASLFLLLVGGALWGIKGAFGLLRPYCIALPLANILLLLAGVLRCAHFLIDPYGTRHILPRPALSALYNLPLPLLLWAQAVLAMIVLRGQRLNLLPPALQCPRVTAGLVALHCFLLFVADILSQALSPALPLMLQTFSVCWGLPLCLGLLFQTLSPLQSTRTPVPQWTAAKRVEHRARRVFSLCTVLGALSYAFQIHGILWLYGLLGNWRSFGWGWWLCQFFARLLELTWSYCMLLLASWPFWRPRGNNRRGEGRPEATQRGKLGSYWDRMLENLPGGPWGMPDRHWAELIPNNWAAHQRECADISSSIIHNHDVVTTSQGQKDSNSDNIGSISTNSTMCDSYPTPLWSHGHDWSERDCILSLIEFDLCPPSPISLTRSIDNALHFDDLLGLGSLFTPPPPSWTQGLEPYCPQAGSATAPATPAHIAYRWALDAGSSPVQPHCFRGSSHHFQTPRSDAQSPLSTTDLRLHLEESDQPPGIQGVIVMEDDWSSVSSTDDITDL
ncbi:proline-rich transmembrane protein 3-like [Alosa alosa]|uniref:proline-rich transmembrane protein 3-like n=1 Tax=Alosa alosa TaxID=278164 RepID=UPI0020153740|nr:proline-rich transmembrane protein 3-like [Alosa alosa]